MNTESIYFCNYSIGEHAYDNVTNVCARYGKRILLFGGVKALCAGKARLEAAIEGSEYAIVDIVLFEQECTYEKNTSPCTAGERSAGGYDLWNGRRQSTGYCKRCRISICRREWEIRSENISNVILSFEWIN